jgi:hypothetical protein
MEWAAERLEPGTIILVPTDQYGGRAKRELQLLYFGGRAKLVDRATYVEAWQWPPDAPPPGTPQAREYVLSGRDETLTTMLAATNPVTEPTIEATTRPATTEPAATPRRKRAKR